MDFKLTAEQEELKKSLSEFCDAEIAPTAAATDESGAFPTDNWKKLAGLGVMALTVPTEYGGAGKDIATALTAISVIAESCASTAQAVGSCRADTPGQPGGGQPIYGPGRPERR